MHPRLALGPLGSLAVQAAREWGILAAYLWRRPSSTRPGIASWLVSAASPSPAAWRYTGSLAFPSPNPASKR